MKKGNLFLIIAAIMFVLEIAFIWYFGNHPEKSLPLWIPYELAWLFYRAWMIAVPVLFVLGIVYKIKKK